MVLYKTIVKGYPFTIAFFSKINRNPILPTNYLLWSLGLQIPPQQIGG